ncbi:hypothetical protein ACFCZ1_19345 [Streptomyces sp. NPDC056224]|uniref:hypothetical protein n=1 Tax=Streptomyces sp. NPDC056224 TaxID=3345750 RepID=UPI0035DDFD1B
MAGAALRPADVDQAPRAADPARPAARPPARPDDADVVDAAAGRARACGPRNAVGRQSAVGRTPGPDPACGPGERARPYM